jgi:phosphoglycolate phosphatase-like HAD superfamily hydrolase
MGNDVHKSKVEKIKMVFQKYGICNNDCVFITDTLGDMREATKMNVGSIGVTWGFNKPNVLKLGNPFCITERPSDLPLAIFEYFNKK